MKHLTKQSLFVLPALVALSFIGWLFFGGVVKSQETADDLMLWLAELPITSAWALAVLVAAMTGMHATGMNIANDYRCDLTKRAAGGDESAYRVLRMEATCWFAMIAMATIVFWVVRR